MNLKNESFLIFETGESILEVLDKESVTSVLEWEKIVILVPKCREIAKQSLIVDSASQFQGPKWLTESTFRD